MTSTGLSQSTWSIFRRLRGAGNVVSQSGGRSVASWSRQAPWSARRDTEVIDECPARRSEPAKILTVSRYGKGFSILKKRRVCRKTLKRARFERVNGNQPFRLNFPNKTGKILPGCVATGMGLDEVAPNR